MALASTACRLCLMAKPIMQHRYMPVHAFRIAQIAIEFRENEELGYKVGGDIDILGISCLSSDGEQLQA